MFEVSGLGFSTQEETKTVNTPSKFKSIVEAVETMTVLDLNELVKLSKVISKSELKTKERKRHKWIEPTKQIQFRSQ